MLKLSLNHLLSEFDISKFQCNFYLTNLCFDLNLMQTGSGAWRVMPFSSQYPLVASLYRILALVLSISGQLLPQSEHLNYQQFMSSGIERLTQLSDDQLRQAVVKVIISSPAWLVQSLARVVTSAITSALEHWLNTLPADTTAAILQEALFTSLRAVPYFPCRPISDDSWYLIVPHWEKTQSKAKLYSSRTDRVEQHPAESCLSARSGRSRMHRSFAPQPRRESSGSRSCRSTAIVRATAEFCRSHGGHETRHSSWSLPTTNLEFILTFEWS